MATHHIAILASLLLLVSRAQTPLPPATSEAKVIFDQIVTLEGTSRGGRVLVRDRAGKVLRIVEAGAGLESLRRAEVRDFTITRDGILAIAFHALLPLGASARYLGLYPQTGPPRLIQLDDVVCNRLAADDLTGLWCLGHGRDEGLAHRVAGERAGRWSLTAPKGIVLDGLTQLFSADPGVLQAWLPATATLVQWDTVTGATNLRQIPMPDGHALSASLLPPAAPCWPSCPCAHRAARSAWVPLTASLRCNPTGNGGASPTRLPGREAPRSPAPMPFGIASSAASTGCPEVRATGARMAPAWTSESACPVSIEVPDARCSSPRLARLPGRYGSPSGSTRGTPPHQVATRGHSRSVA